MSEDREGTCWVEMECPVQEVDFDVEPLPPPGALIDCPHCGGRHVAWEHGQAYRITAGEMVCLSPEEWEALA